MNTAALADCDSTETHDGITWVWFVAITRHWRISVICLRIHEAKASLSGAAIPNRSEDVLLFGAAWARCMAFLAANPHIVLEDP